MKKPILSIIWTLLLFSFLLSTGFADINRGEFHRAIVKDNALRVKEILDKNPAMINSVDPGGTEYPPLHLACLYGSTEVVKLLIRRKVNLNGRSKDGSTPILIAVSSNGEDTYRGDIIKILMKYDVDVNMKDKEGNFPLILAACTDDPEVVELLLKKGARINGYLENFKGDGKWTVLHQAVYLKNRKVIKCLVQHGADIHARTRKGITPLALAKKQNDVETIKLLKSLGAKR